MSEFLGGTCQMEGSSDRHLACHLISGPWCLEAIYERACATLEAVKQWNGQFNSARHRQTRSPGLETDIGEAHMSRRSAPVSRHRGMHRRRGLSVALYLGAPLSHFHLWRSSPPRRLPPPSHPHFACERACRSLALPPAQARSPRAIVFARRARSRAHLARVQPLRPRPPTPHPSLWHRA